MCFLEVVFELFQIVLLETYFIGRDINANSLHPLTIFTYIDISVSLLEFEFAQPYWFFILKILNNLLNFILNNNSVVSSHLL
jgi:hypothetical protein